MASLFNLQSGIIRKNLTSGMLHKEICSAHMICFILQVFNTATNYKISEYQHGRKKGKNMSHVACKWVVNAYDYEANPDPKHMCVMYLNDQ